MCPALALKTDLGDTLAGAPCPTHAPRPLRMHSAAGWLALTQDVGGHPQQRVEHVVHLPVSLHHVCQLLTVHESGGRSGVWGDPLTTMNLP